MAKRKPGGATWHEDPATEKQVAYLRSGGHRIEPGLTKGRACVMIGGEPTEGQIRRLQFYNITVTPYMTKANAMELIDAYKNAHPESEDRYQAWKLSQGIDLKAPPNLPPPLKSAPQSVMGTLVMVGIAAAVIAIIVLLLMT